MHTKFITAALLLSTTLVFAQDTPPSAVNVYFGDLHTHTGYSDGTGTPEQAFAYARDVAKLDFLAVTEHNHLMGGEKSTPAQKAALYQGPPDTALLPTARRMTEDGRFVAIYGQEFSSISKGNHANVLDVDQVIDVPNGKFDDLLRWMDKHRDSSGQVAIVQFNHPSLGPAREKGISKVEFGRDDFHDDAAWVKRMGAVAPLFEMLNGDPLPGILARHAKFTAEQHFRWYLQLGFKVAPVASQDNHKADWGTLTDVRTAILAPELTKPALLAALRRRHVYATEDKNLKLIARIDGHLCGDILPGPIEKPQVSIEISDADEPAATYTVDVFTPTQEGALAERVQTETFAGNGTLTFTGPALGRPGQYAYFRITQQGEAHKDTAWTAPVWIAAAGG